MKRTWTLVLLLFLGHPSCYSQWYNRAVTTIRHSLESLPRLHRAQLPQQITLARGLDRKVSQAIVHASSRHTTTAIKSILTIHETDWFLRIRFPKGTAFVLEEHYQGQKYLWGVTATHYLYQKPAVNLPHHRKSVRVSFEAQSSAGMGDISLFPLPSQLAEQVIPLQLAQQTPHVGDELFSVGFFNKETQFEGHRIVKEITPARMITTLQIDPEIEREGACGSPVLNQHHEVVGLHIGSSSRQEIGYVVPVEHIRRTLAAYHQSKEAAQALRYKGITLGDIHVNESISSVQLYRAEKLLHTISTHYREKYIDYEHLETFLPTEEFDRIVFFIERNPFSMNETDQQYYSFSISYNLKTGEIIRSEEIGYDTPRQ